MNPALPIVVSTAQPLFCTWLELRAALEALHLNQKADVDLLHDVWLNGVPSPEYRVAVPGAVFDERRPRTGDYLVHIVHPLALAKWIQEVSSRRGFPYSERQSIAIAMGEFDSGF